MAEIKNEEAKDKAFVEITIQPGEKIALCRCFKSANMFFLFGFCYPYRLYLDPVRPFFLRIWVCFYEKTVAQTFWGLASCSG